MTTTHDQATAELATHRQLYYVWYTCWDACYGHPDGGGCWDIRICEVTRVTNKRIYFRRDRYSEQEMFVDRGAIEREGELFHNGMREILHLAPPELPNYHQPKSLAELRREMADCHPDRGGDPIQFRAAHARYAAAKTR